MTVKIKEGLSFDNIYPDGGEARAAEILSEVTAYAEGLTAVEIFREVDYRCNSLLTYIISTLGYLQALTGREWTLEAAVQVALSIGEAHNILKIVSEDA